MSLVQCTGNKFWGNEQLFVNMNISFLTLVDSGSKHNNTCKLLKWNYLTSIRWTFIADSSSIHFRQICINWMSIMLLFKKNNCLILVMNTMEKLFYLYFFLKLWTAPLFYSFISSLLNQQISFVINSWSHLHQVLSCS